MDKYFYLMASMPTLTFGMPTAMTAQKFLEEAGQCLGNEYKVLQYIELGAVNGCDGLPGLVRDYWDYDHSLLQIAAAIRAGEKPTGPFVGENPLEIEKNLLRARWDFIDGATINRFFDITAVCAYYLKLKLLESYFVFNGEKGLNNFDRLCEAVL